jgi:hypothetical protein
MHHMSVAQHWPKVHTSHFSLEAGMKQTITLEAYRRLNDLVQAGPDSLALGIKLHDERKMALHDVFPKDGALQVTDWGDTDDEKPHEVVWLTIELAQVALASAVVPGLIWLGTKLAEKGIDLALVEAANYIVAKLRPKQEAKQLMDITISLPGGTKVRVDPPDGRATITITFPMRKPSRSITKIMMSKLPAKSVQQTPSGQGAAPVLRYGEALQRGHGAFVRRSKGLMQASARPPRTWRSPVGSRTATRQCLYHWASVRRRIRKMSTLQSGADAARAAQPLRRPAIISSPIRFTHTTIYFT